MIEAAAILEELRNPSSQKTLLQALRAIKNDVVGHNQRKELWVRNGVIAQLKKILGIPRTSSKQRERTGDSSSVLQHSPNSNYEEARLHALAIIGCLAHGGPRFVCPLRVGQIYPSLLYLISPGGSDSPTTLAALRCLNAIVNAAKLEAQEYKIELEELLKVLCTDPVLSSLNIILSRESFNPVIQQQITLAIELITKIANTERRRKQIKVSGILQTLAVRLSAFVSETTGLRLYPGSTHAKIDIPPSTPDTTLSPLLHCICTVLADSKIRAIEFCAYDIWDKVFPSHVRETHSRRVPIAKEAQPVSDHKRTSTQSATKNAILNHRSLCKWQNIGCLAKAVKDANDGNPFEGFHFGDADDTPLVGWLIEIVKKKDGLVRLMATWLVGLFLRCHMISVIRKRRLKTLLVPILVGMFDGETRSSDTECTISQPGAVSTSCLMRELAPRVLSYFVQDSKALQASATGAGAVKKLSQLLKQTFDPIPDALLIPEWHAKDAEEASLHMDPSESSMLDRQGVHPIIYHTLQVREALLLGISAMATLDESTRQNVIDSGVIPCLVESLQPNDGRSFPADLSDTKKPHNTHAVLIAACTAARSLSRSVAILRTSLVDAGVQKPIFNLLEHQNIDVQVAATAAVANILLPFSALRNDIINSGVMHVLCRQAHSADSRLRVNALWALSSLAAQTDNEMKIQMVKELGPGWLKQIICTGTAEETDAGRFGEHPSFDMMNASGEHIDILNALEGYRAYFPVNNGSHADVTMADDADSEPRMERIEPELATDERFDARVDRRAAAVQTARDNLAVQEQGLSLVRNLLVGGTEANDIVDYLFREMGQDNLFNIFTNLLKPRATQRQERNGGPLTLKFVPPPTEIVTGVCFILTNIAGGIPPHKDVIIAQTELLRLLLPLYGHPLPEVRVTLIWLVINLCWKEDSADITGAAHRATKLREIGIIAKVHSAEHDSDLDVRERAKQALSTLSEPGRNG